MNPLNPEQVDALLTAAGLGSTVHLVGAGGCGMSGLGHLLLDLGHGVTGSDLQANEEVRQLRERGAHIQRGHDAALLRSAQPVLVVFTPAVRPDNPELQAARELHIPVVRRATVLAALLRRQRGICVAGMHGKTTTSALLAFALENLGARPSYAVGALVPQLPRHAHFSHTAANPQQCFVIEADESDGTLREFRPELAILLNVDAEHLDHYDDLESVCGEFAQFAAQTSRLKIYCKDDANLCRLLDHQPGAVSYGFHPRADYRIEIEKPEDQRQEAEGNDTDDASRFTLHLGAGKLGDFTTALIGEKNVSNAAAVIALLHALGYAAADIARAIAPFRGAVRRQELLYGDAQVHVFDDYAHHPTEIRATLRAFRQWAPRRLLAAFQPHRYTRTQALLKDFASCFLDADELWLTEIYAASEPPIPGVTSAVLAQAIRAQGQPVEYVPPLRELGPAILSAIQPGDLVVFLGAGDITKVAHDVAARCQQPRSGTNDHSAGLGARPSSGIPERDAPSARRQLPSAASEPSPANDKFFREISSLLAPGTGGRPAQPWRRAHDVARRRCRGLFC